MEHFRNVHMTTAITQTERQYRAVQQQSARRPAPSDSRSSPQPAVQSVIGAGSASKPAEPDHIDLTNEWDIPL